MNDEKDDPERVVPILDEEVIANKKVVKTGSVRVQKHVDKRTEHVNMPLMRETVEVRRIPMNRVVETVPQIRTQGDTTVIPVVEEELVVTKRLVLKEEIHLVKHRTRQDERRDVTVDKERAEVMRMDAQGRVEGKGEDEPKFAIGGHHRPVLRKE
jgi:uncharacterized protein (TIGR02271 family)